MDTQQARDLLSGMQVQRGKEVEALQVAIDIIDNKLNLELNALKDEKAKTAQLNSEKEALTQQVAELNNIMVEEEIAPK